MTDSEAIGFIQGKLDCMNKCCVFNKEDNISDNDCDNCEYCYSQGNFENQKEAFQMALQALEKQIPKKRDSYNCPVCSHYFEDGECFTYCPECGQRLGGDKE